MKIYVCNNDVGVLSMHDTKLEGLVSARETLDKEPELKVLFVCDWMNRFEPVMLEAKKPGLFEEISNAMPKF